MIGGYVVELLRINLTTGKILTEDLNFQLARKLIGGTGYAAKVIYDEINQQTDQSDPENLLIFMAGPIVGSMFPRATKWRARKYFCLRGKETGINKARGFRFFGGWPG